jgi:hypothetical protein
LFNSVRRDSAFESEFDLQIRVVNHLWWRPFPPGPHFASVDTPVLLFSTLAPLFLLTFLAFLLFLH